MGLTTVQRYCAACDVQNNVNGLYSAQGCAFWGRKTKFKL